jgi:hypothetical protein
MLATFLDAKAVELPGEDIVRDLMADIRLSGSPRWQAPAPADVLPRLARGRW